MKLSANVAAVAAAFLLVFVTGCPNKATESKDGKELTVKVADQSITQDKTTDVSVGVTRKGFTDPVKVSFEGLPSGVKLTTTDMEIPKDKDSAKFTLKADKDAKPGDYEAKATAKSGDMSKSVTFKVTVKEDK
jgi:hypothetical protein